MVGAAQRAMDVATSVAGIRLYVRELLTQYSALLQERRRERAAPARGALRVRADRRVPQLRRRGREGEGDVRRALQLRRPDDGDAFETLHFAGKEFERDGARPTRRRPAANNASGARRVQGVVRRRIQPLAGRVQVEGVLGLRRVLESRACGAQGRRAGTRDCLESG